MISVGDIVKNGGNEEILRNKVESGKKKLCLLDP